MNAQRVDEHARRGHNAPDVSFREFDAPGMDEPAELDNLSREQVMQMRQEARASQQGLTRQVSEALRRGNTVLERSSAWPFDIYQATGLYPVDYKYWERDVETSVGPSKCLAMHAHAYTPGLDQIAADQVFHREIMKEAHSHAIQSYMQELERLDQRRLSQ